ncbi:hypothetical protein [Vibrio breoganii]|uniref:hypothetical protein n=1 Tax=Vibrio breoganii TaxID=553239 RepID=UPI0021C42391|nr:hypothetical protein [Vibrio breoganii]MDN3717771.1 hypothetical protein [Vibrio breoganii]
MCKFGDEIRLCTCTEDVDTSKPHWVLFSKNEIQEDRKSTNLPKAVGSFAFKPATVSESEILSKLNEKNCFDFDYNPKSGDKLLIKFEGVSFQFEFSGFDEWILVIPTFKKAKYTKAYSGYLV